MNNAALVVVSVVAVGFAGMGCFLAALPAAHVVRTVVEHSELRTEATGGEVESLRRRVEELERGLAKADAAPPASPAGQPTPGHAARGPGLEGAMLAEHNAESRNPAWATASEAEIGKRLGELASKGHYRVEGVDCRASSCVANLRWDSYEQVGAEARTAVEAPPPVNCKRSMYRPPADDPGAPYAAHLVYFGCE